MSDLPIVTIVTPSYNQARYLEETILSVLNQDYPRLEYLIIDGGSTDGSVEIIRKHENRLAYWVSEPDDGQSHAVNKGFERATGTVLAWLNSDDTYEPGAVRSAVEAFIAFPHIDAVYGDCTNIDPTGAVMAVYRARPLDLSNFLTDCFIHQPTVFMRRRVRDLVGPLDPSFQMCMDYEYWLRTAAACRWLYIPRVLAHFRVHTAAKSQARAQEFLDERLRCLDRLFADPRLAASVAGVRKRAYALAYVTSGINLYEAGALREARDHFLAALRWDPNPFHWRTLEAGVLMVDLLTGLRVGKRLLDLHLRGRWWRLWERVARGRRRTVVEDNRARPVPR